MKSRAFGLLASLALLGLLPGPALASTYTTDQSNTGIDHYLIGSYIDAQTFTAGLYGPMDSVELYLTATATASVYVSLQGTTGNPAVPNGTVLASKTLGVTGGYSGWVRFSFSTSAIVIPGHVYAIVFTPTDLVYVDGSQADAYPRGRALVFFAGAWVSPPSLPSNPVVVDWAFRTNVGPAAPTPTPTPRPTPTHAPTPTATPTAAATPTPTDTPTAAPTSTPAATASPAPTDTAAAAAVPSGAGAGSGSGSGSGSSGDSTLPMIGAGIAVLALVVGGLAFLLMRRRQAQAGG